MRTGAETGAPAASTASAARKSAPLAKWLAEHPRASAWTGLPAPFWVPLTTSVVAVALFLTVALQRNLLVHPRLGLLLAAVACAPWLISWRWPLPVLLWAAMTIGTVTALIYHQVNNDFAPFVLVYLAGTAATALESTVASSAMAVACASPMIALSAAGRFGGAVIWCFACVFAWFFGTGFRWQLSLLNQLQEAQAGLADAAAVAERQRLAREIHDLIAHSMTVAMLHITGARLALGHGDQEEALAGLAQAERTGREAMAEIRRTVGLLDGGDGATAAPAPSAVDIDELVAGYRSAGLEVRAELDPEIGDLPAGLGLTLYRVVQESLTNASKHAPAAPVTVSVALNGGQVTARVANPVAPALNGSAPDSGGLGLVGMRQRIDLVGGEMRAGPHGDQWVVEATIPWTR